MYIVKKKIAGHDYYYLNKSVRKGDKVISKNISYLGKDKKQAEKKAKEIMEKETSEKEVKEERKEVKEEKVTYEDIMNLVLRRSFFFPSAKIYEGPAGFWDFGPYGTAIRRKIIQLWRKEFVEKENMLEIYGSQIMPEHVFKASGHLSSLIDPIVRCEKCKVVYRADELLTVALKKHIPESLSEKEFNNLIKKNRIKCLKCEGKLSAVEKVSLMVGTTIGVGKPIKCYLRPETCQSIFLDFARLVKTMRVTLPKGIAQVGRAFRNEISPRQSLFREVEFSQFEVEVFFNPDKINEIENFDEVKNYKIRIMRIEKEEVEEISAEDLVKKKIVSGRLVAYYMVKAQQLYEKFGINKERVRFRQVGKEERPFYSKETWDFEIFTALGWIEVIANNYRTDYDLKGHMKGSKEDLTIIEEGKKFIPHIWEISAGVDRTLYAIIDNAFRKEQVKKEERIVLALNPKLAPYDVTVFPLVNKQGMPKIAKKIYENLKKEFSCFYDDSGSIGRRYRRVDEIGVFLSVTVDGQTLNDNTVTIRNRDSMKQIRVKIINLPNVIKDITNDKMTFEKAGKLIN